MASMVNESSSQPLLGSSSNTRASETVGPQRTHDDEEGVHPNHPFFSRRHYTYHREWAQRFLASHYQHWLVLSLVAADLSCIFADIFITLYTCEEGKPSPTLDKIRDGLNLAGLVFSCMFMVELLLSIWAFGWRYFQSAFHSFDAFVIIAGFIVDVLLHGVLEEIASLVVVLRLWRFFKIIEEFSVGAQEQMDGLEMRINGLETENRELKQQILQARGDGGIKHDEESGLGEGGLHRLQQQPQV